jgi:predicted transcriptional regulator
VHRYFPVASQEAMQTNALSRVVAKFFAGSPVSVMAHLLESGSLSADELRTLHRHLDMRLNDLEERD